MLIYYCQAWSLGWDGVPLFDEEFEAWANGPVCVELFDVHRGMFVVDESLFADIPKYHFTKDEYETMDAVMEYYGGL
ncbi:MAG: Panacea domain-containing protein [Faecalimonas sp.]|nr:Panacea domain-containing protein [Faecalimonas sp.]